MTRLLPVASYELQEARNSKQEGTSNKQQANGLTPNSISRKINQLSDERLLWKQFVFRYSSSFISNNTTLFICFVSCLHAIPCQAKLYLSSEKDYLIASLTYCIYHSLLEFSCFELTKREDKKIKRERMRERARALTFTADGY